MSGALVVIPARLGSTRFPAKVLRELGGVPVVEWCRRAALRADVGPVVVATESSVVAGLVEGRGGAVVMTSPSCVSGTDRVHEALRLVERRSRRRFSRVINLQGDEPLIQASTIRKVARLLEDREVDIATAVVPLVGTERAAEPSVVKAAVSRDGRCLYFSRSAIPYPAGADGGFLQHIGIYGFQRAALERFVRLPPSPLELREKLEQLRAMEAGMSIFAAKVADRTVAIDVPADLRRAAAVLAGR
ncbi:MAG TPA: 3-deoxy-manno-octulosonate cytidylyltransferase [Elusimicrobiota bacterium]|jgi:3-deoxy-manno-octulosonate cytidylyltransferase (CMP-KDO synthetase)|nr:3-deoxy-manno-octulosonate cytidylyltransferase [Elusimicrobiota bacterium]